MAHRPGVTRAKSSCRAPTASPATAAKKSSTRRPPAPAAMLPAEWPARSRPRTLFPSLAACTSCKSEQTTATAYVPAVVLYEGNTADEARTQTKPEDVGFRAIRVECKSCHDVRERRSPARSAPTTRRSSSPELRRGGASRGEVCRTSACRRARSRPAIKSGPSSCAGDDRTPCARGFRRSCSASPRRSSSYRARRRSVGRVDAHRPGMRPVVATALQTPPKTASPR